MARDAELKFKIAILDETKDKLTAIKKSLSELKDYTQGVSTGISNAVQSIMGLSKSLSTSDMEGFITSIKKLQKSLHQTDAFEVPGLKSVAEQLKNLQTAFSGTKLPADLQKSMEQFVRGMSIAEKQLGSASLSTLETYRSQFGAASNDIMKIVGKIRETINSSFGPDGNITKNGFGSLMKLSGLKYEGEIKQWVTSMNEAFAKMESGMSRYKSSMDDNLGLNGIINKIDNVTIAINNVRRNLSGKGILDPVVRKDETNFNTITERLRALESQLQKFGENIGNIVNQIKSTLQSGLSEALNTDISGTKTVQGLQELATGLNGLKDSLAQSKEVAQQVNQAAQTLKEAKTNLAAAAGGGATTNTKGETTFAGEQATDARTYVSNILKLSNAIAQLQRAYDAVAESRKKIADSKGDTKGADDFLDRVKRQIEMLKDLQTKIDVIGQKGLMLIPNEANVQAFAELLKNSKGSVEQMLTLIEWLGNATPKGIIFQKMIEEVRKFKQEAQEAENAQKKLAESPKAKTDSVISALTKQINQLKETSRSAAKVEVDDSKVKEAIVTLERYRRALEYLAQRNGRAGSVTTESLISSKGFQEATAAASRYMNEVRGVTQANKDLAHSENTVAQAIGNTTNAARNQSQVLSDLKSMAAQYISVWGAQQFLSDMVQITGELELQRKSLEVILGSGTAAAEMYAQLRDLSQQSPYTFEDLLKAHRQLAAFGIEAKNIYGTMKSLTDIGAGLDVPVERLILAYGHTKSYGYLSGIQNRQFETAGIDLVGALSNLYNRRADAAKEKGQTANYRSRKDIFALMRKREIPFEDVEEVIMDLDKPGGKFYNMQERQYDTLGGKLRNLRNNYRIMQSEIGGSNRNILMGIVDTINDVTEHWEKYAAILRDVAVAYGSLKIASLIAGKTIVSQANGISAAARNVSNNARGANFLNNVVGGRGLGYWRNLWNMGTVNRWLNNASNNSGFSSNGRLANTARWDAVKEIAQNKELTTLQKQRIALTAKLSKAQRAYLLEQTKIEPAQARTIAHLGAIRRGLISARLGFIQLAASVRAFGAALLSQFAIMAPIMAITELIGRAREQTRKAESLAKDFREQSETNRKSAEEILNNYASRGLIDLNQGTEYDASGMRLDTNKITLNRENLRGKDLTSDIEELKKKLQVLSPIYDGDLLDINKFETQEQQFEALINKIESIRRANQVQESIASNLANADKRVAGNYALTRAFGDTFTEDMQDYMESYRNMRQDLQKEFTDKESRDYTSDKDLEAINEATGGMLETLKNGYGLLDYREALAVYFRKIAQMTDEERQKVFVKLRSVKLTGGNTVAHLYAQTANPWFGKNLDTQYRQMVDDAKEWSKSLGNDIISRFAQDPEGAVAAMMNSVNTFLASAGVTDPAIKQEIIDAVIQSLNDKNNGFNISGSYGGQNLQNEALGNLYAEALTKQQFAQYLNGLRGEMSDAEGLEVFNDAFNKIQTYIKQHNYKFAALGEDSGKSWFKGMYDGAFNSLKANSAWQKRAMKAITIDQELKVKINSAVDIYAFAEDVQKKIKEARDRIEKMIPHIKTLQARMGINFNISASTTVAEIAKQREALEKKLNQNKSTYNLSNEAWQKSAAGQALLAIIRAEEELVNQYQKLESDLGSVKEGTTYLKDEGFKDAEEEKRQKKLEEAKRKKKAADRKADQTTIKNLESRYNAIKKVYEWYKRWYELLGNSDAAMDAAKNLVDASDIKGINLNDLKSWETYVKLLERERDAVGKTKLRLPKENADRLKQIQTNYTDTIDRGDADEFSRNQDRTASALERQLEMLGKQYDLYKKIYELTGDRNLAVRLSGRNVSDTRQSKADDYKQAIQSNLDEARRSLNLGAFNLDFDRLFGMDDEKIKQAVGTMLNIDDEGKVLQNNKQLALQYKAIVDALKKWRDIEVDLNKKGAETYSQILGDLKDINTEISKIEAKRKTRKQDIDNIRGTDQKPLSSEERKRAYQIIDQEADTEKLQKTAGYIALMNNALSMGETDFVDNLDKAFDDLNRRLATDAITASDYAKEMAKLEKISSDYHNKGFFGRDSSATAFLEGGLTGQLQWVNNHLEVRRAILAEEIRANNPNYTEGQINEIINSDEQIRSWEDLRSKIVDATGNIKSFSSVVTAVSAVFDGLQQAAQNLANMFDALGNESMANFFSDFADVTGAIGSIFSPVSNVLQNAMSGNIGGIISSAISAPISMITSPITAFAKLHDKQIQRKIDRIQQDLSKIEAYSQTIAKAQDRTLGFDNGDLIRSYQQRYANNTETIQRSATWNLFGSDYTDTWTEVRNKEGKAGEAMAKYYGAAGADTDISGYEQQYNMLIKQRQDYVDMYNAENSKKKKSKESLNETSQKIAELDDEIRYFSEDLANKLFGIDLKSWADQLGDALMTAFENGEDAAEAFDNTVTNILQGLVKKMVSTGVIEPLLQQLENKLFGYTDESGVRHEGSFKVSDPYGSRNAWMADINDALGENGYVREGIDASQVLFDSAEELANKYGNTLMNTNSDSMSSSIKGITETTADLLASYLNAIRADVSVVRQVQSQFVYTLWPEYIRQITGYSSSLQSIDTNVQAIRSLMSENGALFEQVRTLRDDLHGLVTQQKYIRVS